MDLPSTIDRVVELEPGRAARAIRNVPATLTVFDSHFPRFPVLPGVAILQSLADLGRHAMASDGNARWRLAGADRIKFRSYVAPGDQLELVVDVVDHDGPRATLRARAYVEGRLVTAGRLRFVPEAA